MAEITIHIQFIPVPSLLKSLQIKKLIFASQ